MKRIMAAVMLMLLLCACTSPKQSEAVSSKVPSISSDYKGKDSSASVSTDTESAPVQQEKEQIQETSRDMPETADNSSYEPQHTDTASQESSITTEKKETAPSTVTQQQESSKPAAESSQSPSPTAPKRYLAEDYGMTYAQMEDICRKYVESLGLQYDPTFTTENAGFTGRVTSFGDTWEKFYESICRWTDATVELCSPKSIRVQFIRGEDGTFEYAYVLWM